MLAVAITGCCVDPQNKICHPAGYRLQLWARGILTGSETRAIGFLGLRFELWIEFGLWFEKKETSGITTCRMNNLERD